jgi:hypothetical protein
MLSVSYFTGIPPPKQYRQLYLHLIVIYVPSNAQRGREIYMSICMTNNHDTYRVLPKKQNVNLAR